MWVQDASTTFAAPGCSRRLQVIVLEDRPEYIAADAAAAEKQRQEFEPLVIVNPILRPLSDDGARFFEGCLSVPGYQVRAARPPACLSRLQELSWSVWQDGGGPLEAPWAIQVPKRMPPRKEGMLARFPVTHPLPALPLRRLW